MYKESCQFVADALPCGVLLLEYRYDSDNKVAECRILDINRAFTRIAGISSEQLKGKFLSDVFMNQEGSLPVWFRLLENIPDVGSVSGTEFFNSTNRKWYKADLSTLNDNKLIVVFTDMDVEPGSKSERLISEVNNCLINLGPDYIQNINAITALCGTLLHASVALYNRLDSQMLCSFGQWNTPDDYNSVVTPEGHICYDVIRSKLHKVVIVEDLQHSAYVDTDPTVKLYSLQTYAGYPVFSGGEAVGSLCVLYTDNRVPDVHEQGVLSILAAAIGSEEQRMCDRKALLESEKKNRKLSTLLRLMADTMPDMIWAKNLKKEYIFVNKSICANLLNASDTEEPIDKNDLFFAARERQLHPENPNWHTFGEICSDTDTITLDAMQHMQFEESGFVKGNYLCLDVHKAPLFDDDGHLIGVVGSARDITHAKKTEKQLVDAKEKAEESDKLKTSFINNISHEIRTPLNGILGFAYLLSRPDVQDQDRTSLFAYLEQSCNRLLNTMTDYMDMAMIVSKTMVMNKAKVDFLQLLDVVEDEANRLCMDRDLVFELKINPDVTDYVIQTDKDFIHRILYKLIDNAVKFTEKGSVSLHCNLLTNRLECKVTDTGCGIESVMLGQIFEMFSQTDTSLSRGYEGSGLGLAIAKGLVALLDGEITASSSLGSGSEFSFSIPVVTYNEPGNVNELRQHSISAKKPLILIAEDDDLNLQYMMALLSTEGIDSIYAENGELVVEYCRTNPDITFVLMDVKMPVMDGEEATRKIKEFRPDLPIVATTAYAQTGDVHRYLAAGCVEYIAKPIAREKILSLIEQYNSI